MSSNFVLAQKFLLLLAFFSFFKYNCIFLKVFSDVRVLDKSGGVLKFLAGALDGLRPGQRIPAWASCAQDGHLLVMTALVTRYLSSKCSTWVGSSS
jgi:hypothetical protein